MKTRNIIIGVLVLGGAYWYWNKYMKKPSATSTNDTNDISKPQREIAPKPQTSSPNVQKPSMSSAEATNTCVKGAKCVNPALLQNFMDFDGELELHRND
jgi:hypothetical protein